MMNSSTTPADKNMKLVEATNLVAGYLPGINILNGCNLYANQGELVGIIGPNGAGINSAQSALWLGQDSRRFGNPPR
jgi:branched-chain amino acid transport system ATP-binding protein